MPFITTAPLRRAIEQLLPDRPFTIASWDGSIVPPTSDHGPVVRLRSHRGVAHVLDAPARRRLSPEVHRVFMSSALHCGRVSHLEEPMRHGRPDRYEPTLAYALADRARTAGIDLDAAPGPWRASLRRHELELISVVTNGRIEIMVGDMERAADVAGLLNWCGVDDLRPVPDLRPPSDSEPIEDRMLKAAG
jgi:hypothetical protein